MSLVFVCGKSRKQERSERLEMTPVLCVDGVRKGINLVIFLLLSSQAAIWDTWGMHSPCLCILKQWLRTKPWKNTGASRRLNSCDWRAHFPTATGSSFSVMRTDSLSNGSHKGDVLSDLLCRVMRVGSLWMWRQRDWPEWSKPESLKISESSRGTWFQKGNWRKVLSSLEP